MSQTLTSHHADTKIASFRLVWQRFSLLFLIALAIFSTVSATYVLVNRIHFARVLSDSMKPQFQRGDVLLLKPIDKTQLTTGEIALLPLIKEPGLQYTHRITNVTNKNGVVAVETKGDANPAADPWQLIITSEEVPVVVGSFPASSLPFISTTRSTLIALSALLLLIFISMFIPFRRTRTSKPQSLEQVTHRSG